VIRKEFMGDRPIRRRPGANNLPGSTTLRDDKWKTPLGLMAILLGCEYDIEKAGSAERLAASADRASLGIRAHERYEQVCRLLPDLDAHVRSYGNKTEPWWLFDNRMRYLYYEHWEQSGTGMRLVISNEHPMRSKRRRPFWELGRKVFLEGRPLTRERAEELVAEVRSKAGEGAEEE